MSARERMLQDLGGRRVYGCGCACDIVGIYHCSIHAAAPELLEVADLTARGGYIERFLSLAARYEPKTYQSWREHAEALNAKLYAAIVKAGGKP